MRDAVLSWGRGSLNILNQAQDFVREKKQFWKDVSWDESKFLYWTNLKFSSELHRCKAKTILLPAQCTHIISILSKQIPTKPKNFSKAQFRHCESQSIPNLRFVLQGREIRQGLISSPGWTLLYTSTPHSVRSANPPWEQFLLKRHKSFVTSLDQDFWQEFVICVSSFASSKNSFRRIITQSLVVGAALVTPVHCSRKMTHHRIPGAVPY